MSSDVEKTKFVDPETQINWCFKKGYRMFMFT